MSPPPNSILLYSLAVAAFLGALLGGIVVAVIIWWMLYRNRARLSGHQSSSVDTEPASFLGRNSVETRQQQPNDAPDVVGISLAGAARNPQTDDAPLIEGRQPEIVPNLSPLDELVHLYNSDAQQFSERVTFRRGAYSQAGDGAVLNEVSFGRFLIVEVGGLPYALPHPKVRIDETSYHDTGLSELFECRGYEAGHSYDSYRLVKPARLSADASRLLLVERGVLEML
jgi:hypothetical protein